MGRVTSERIVLRESVVWYSSGIEGKIPPTVKREGFDCETKFL